MDYDVLALLFLSKKLKYYTVRVFLWVHSAKFQSKDLIYQTYKSIFKYIFKKHIDGIVEKVIVNGDYIKNQIVTNLAIPPNRVEVIQYPSEIEFSPLEKNTARQILGFGKSDKIILFFGM